MSRGDSRPGKRYGGPWYGQSSELIRFVGSSRQAFPGLRHRAISKVGFEVRVQLDVPYYERRNVRILFERSDPDPTTGNVTTPYSTRVFGKQLARGKLPSTKCSGWPPLRSETADVSRSLLAWLS